MSAEQAHYNDPLLVKPTAIKNKVILGVQYLRFIAAALVVMNHGWPTLPKIGRGNLGQSFYVGAAGVDIFFAISGFIMIAITARKDFDRQGFFLKRMLRIAPPYWVATFIMAAILIAAPTVFTSNRWSLISFLTSLVFVAWFCPIRHTIEPLLQVGWTLNYEMLFYAIFAISLVLAPKKRLELSTSILFALVIFGWVYQPSHHFAQFYTSPIMLEFVIGMYIGHLYVRGSTVSFWYAIALLVFAFVMLMTAAINPVTFDASRVLFWGVPSALILYAVVSLEARLASQEMWLFHLLGDASYAIYLTHLFALGAVRFVCGRFNLAAYFPDSLLLLFMLLGSIGVGLLFYWCIELPLINKASFLNRGHIRKVGRR